MIRYSNKIQDITEYSTISIDLIKDHIKDDRLSCQLRQIVTRKLIYPNAKFISGALNYRVFERKQTRVCWVDVPLNTNVFEIQERLKNLPNARIYQILSTDINDILTDGHKYYIEKGELSLEDLKEKYTLKCLGSPVKSLKGNIIYRNCKFSETNQKDINKIK